MPVTFLPNVKEISKLHLFVLGLLKYAPLPFHLLMTYSDTTVRLISCLLISDFLELYCFLKKIQFFMYIFLIFTRLLIKMYMNLSMAVQQRSINTSLQYLGVYLERISIIQVCSCQIK